MAEGGPEDARNGMWERQSGRILVIGTAFISLLILGLTVGFSITEGPGFRFGRGGEGREVPEIGQRSWEAVILVNISVEPEGNRSSWKGNATLTWDATDAFYDGNATVPLGQAVWLRVPKSQVLDVEVRAVAPDGCAYTLRATIHAWRDGDRYERTLESNECP